MSEHQITRREFVRTSAVAAATVATALEATRAGEAPGKKILCHNKDMEYRRLGKTDLMISAVCLGGHWKRVNVMKQDFDENRRQVVDRCMEVGINYIDACAHGEVMAYSKALRGRRDKMHLGLSFCEREARGDEFRTSAKLIESLDTMLKDSGQEYTDLWRITCFEPGGDHTFNTSCEIADALEKAKKQGKARFIGISSHDRRWHKMMIEQFPQIDVILFPYTAKSKALPEESLFDVVKKMDVGVFGIKPFASNSLFKGTSDPNDPNADEDNRLARLAIRYILCNPAITAPIPGLISTKQVDNVAKAIAERRQYDMGGLEKTGKADLERATEGMWARLDPSHLWLKDWEFV